MKQARKLSLEAKKAQSLGEYGFYLWNSFALILNPPVILAHFVILNLVQDPMGCWNPLPSIEGEGSMTEKGSTSVFLIIRARIKP